MNHKREDGIETEGRTEMSDPLPSSTGMNIFSDDTSSLYRRISS